MAGYYARVTGEEAEDLAQEAWIGALSALDVLDVQVGDPDQHLLRRARWRLLDAVRREKRLRPDRADDLEVDRLASPGESQGLETAAALEFLGRLNNRHQRILACLMSGHTWREAGVLLGCSSANIAHHMRGIRRCAEEAEFAMPVEALEGFCLSADVLGNDRECGMGRDPSRKGGRT